MTDNSHALTQITVDTTVMFPRYKPDDLLFLKRFCPPEYARFPDTDIAVATSDGRITLGRFRAHDIHGVTLFQLAHPQPVLIARERLPILYRITGIAPCLPPPKDHHQSSAA
ncbi:hypothetical protein TH8_19805 [Thalassospira profundimaris]|nr:hypothetical protein TH8_19805 [Thalassospira profundimaris]